MKRSPLKRKTPLKRSGGLRRGLGSLKRSRLSPVSDKRREQNKVYSRLRDDFLQTHPICQRCNQRKSEDLHHKAGRIGELLIDVRYFSAVCRKCHDEIHADAKTAAKEGWIIRL